MTLQVNQDFFEYKYEPLLKTMAYVLNTDMLSKDRCNLLFPAIPSIELVITGTLEFGLFHPSHTQMNDQFSVVLLSSGKLHWTWISFPKEYKEACERIGKIFKMEMKSVSRTCFAGLSDKVVRSARKDAIVPFSDPRDNHIIANIPKADHIFMFQGEHFYEDQTLNGLHENAKWFGTSCERLGID